MSILREINADSLPELLVSAKNDLTQSKPSINGMGYPQVRSPYISTEVLLELTGRKDLGANELADAILEKVASYDQDAARVAALSYAIAVRGLELQAA
ncbi:MAG: hypothetical protein WAO98_10395 [Alphaproteobacteria bacterium]